MQGTVKMYAVKSFLGIAESHERWKIKNLYIIGFIYNCRIYIVHFQRPVTRSRPFQLHPVYVRYTRARCSILDSKKHTNTAIITA